jgi:hypothetical protein
MGGPVETREVSFDEFLHAFAEAIELAAAGEVEEGHAVLADARRVAAQGSGADPVAQGALLYRCETAERIFDSRYR